MQKHRNSIVDLWRFLAILLIMIHHLYHIESFANAEYYGRFSWIYVEFFFILTGYFTYSHFKRHNSDDSNIFKSGLKYTFQKFKGFIPYTTIAISLQYLITAPFSSLEKGQFKLFLSHFLNYPLSMPMFIWHWMIGTIINRLTHIVLIPVPIQLVIYFGGTIILSIISLFLISKGESLFLKQS